MAADAAFTRRLFTESNTYRGVISTFSPRVAVLSFLIGTLAGYLASVALTLSSIKKKDGAVHDDGIESDNSMVSVVLDMLKRYTLPAKEDKPSTKTPGKEESSETLQQNQSDAVEEAAAAEGVVIIEGEEDTIPEQKEPPPSKKEEKSSIRMVVQRCRSASVLLPSTSSIADFGSIIPLDQDPTETSPVGGLIVYISLAKTVTESSLFHAAKTLLNMPILTRGKWGDGSNTLSVLQMAKALSEEGGGGGDGVFVMIIPQANLISKVKNNGKSIQYHDQVDKTKGSKLFSQFLNFIKLLSLDHEISLRPTTPTIQKSVKNAIAAATNTNPNAKQFPPDIPPSKMFHDESLFTSWDDSGFPLTDAQGQQISQKSKLKKMKKLYEAQKKRHAKFLSEGGAPGSVEEEDFLEKLDPKFIRVVAGEFGQRQGLQFSSDMGPFCHVLNL